MTADTQHILITSLAAGGIGAVFIMIVASLVIVIEKIVEGESLWNVLAYSLFIPVVITVATFLLSYGYMKHNEIQNSIDDRGDIRFSISDDGITIWARKPDSRKASDSVRESLR